MQENPDQFSQLLLEADGLLLVLLRHREDTPVDAIKLLRKKLNMILAITDDIEYDSEEEVLNEAGAGIISEHEEHEEIMESEESEEAEDDIYDDTDPNYEDADHETYSTEYEHTEDEYDSSVGEYIEETVEDACEEADNSTPQPTAPSMEPIEIPEASVDDDETEEEHKPVIMEEVHPAMIEKEAPVIMDKEDVVFYDDSKNEPVLMDNTQVVDMKPDSVTNSIEMPRSQSSYSYTYYPEEYNDDLADNNYEEATSNRQSTASTEESTRRPIKTAFNLNDKFRFRRELFGNSDAAYVECLDMLQAMNSIGEAREYLVEDLNWDLNNEDVKAFIELLEKYYNK